MYLTSRISVATLKSRIEVPARGRRRGGVRTSLRHVRGNYEWERTYIREEQRYKDRFTNPQYAHMRGVDQTVTDLPWTFFWAFVPMNALEEALALMTGIGRRAWPDFQLSRSTSSFVTGPPTMLVCRIVRRQARVRQSSHRSVGGGSSFL